MPTRNNSSRRAKTILDPSTPNIIIVVEGGDLAPLGPWVLTPQADGTWQATRVGTEATLSTDGQVWTLSIVNSAPLTTTTWTARATPGQNPPSYDFTNATSPWTSVLDPTGDDLMSVSLTFNNRKL